MIIKLDLFNSDLFKRNKLLSLIYQYIIFGKTHAGHLE